MSGATTFAGRSARQQHRAPHPTRPPRPLPSYPLLACLLGSLGCWARGRLWAGRSAVCRLAPPGGMEAHRTPVDLMTSESSADT